MIACAALGTLAAAEVANGAPPQAAVRSEKGVPSLPLHDKTEQDFSLPQLSAFPEITQRPLFNGTRRPALAADQSGQAWSTFVLQGVILSPGTREALVSHLKPAVFVSLREGKMLDGWIAESILSDRVVFRNGDVEQELTLGVARNTPTPTDRAETVLPSPASRPQPPSL